MPDDASVGSDIIVEITPSPIDPSEATGLVTPAAGALVTFVGTVRDKTDDREVSSLSYEAYSSMASDVLRRIGEEAIDKWDIGKVALIHRVGDLQVGEISVLVAVAAPHRGEAFSACSYCIDTLKTEAPIWKKEIFTDGESHWVNHP